jgi:hypothetical protein
MIAELIRLEESYTWGTFGVLKLDKQVFCVTLEPRDEENAPFVSSIPAQQYECARYSSEKYPHTFQVLNVPNRDRILFHAGNKVEDTEGCILLAEHFGKLRGDRAILNSGRTFQYFLDALRDHDRFHFTIHEVY